MQIRFMMVAAAALGLSASAFADPATPAEQDTAQPASKPARVVLASAEPVQAPDAVAEPQQSQTPVKRRAARVTTCRCGGQNSEH